ncbi:retrotransposon protein, putative, ty1-copia subclass, partial [Tanacetum coccineum]
HIRNNVPTKKVNRTPYEIWHGKAPKLSYLRVWGCYPKETIEVSGRDKGLKIIQEEYTQPSENTSKEHNEVAPIEIDVEEYELGDFDEPPYYKAALADPESDKWLKAMKMQSMKDNQVWILVKFPPNGQTIGSKWIFKKKTDMDGNVHTFKARLVAKGYTQSYGVDYGETFYPVADIRAIRILLAIATFYDYDIWQMDVKTTFLNGHLNLGEAAYILGIKIIRDRSKRLIALSQSAHFEKILKKFRLENSKKRYTPMMEKPDYRKSQGAKTPAEVQRMQRVPYVLTKDMVLVYGAKSKDELKVSCYADASFQTDKDDTKSQMRYVFVLNGGAVDWKSAKQSTTAMSSIEAEYIVAAEASMKAVWMRKFIDGLGGVMPSNKRPMEMLCENKPALAIASDPKILKGARHF